MSQTPHGNGGSQADQEVPTRPIALLVIGTGVVVALILWLTVGIYDRVLAKVQDEAELAAPSAEWTALRAKEKEELEKAWYLDRKADRVHLPISAAMEKVVRDYSR